MMTVRERLHAYMNRHRLTRQRMADALSTPVKTMDSWLYEGVTPPAVMVRMLDLLEQHSKVRTWAGAIRSRERRRGRAFQPGHPYRFNDPRRPQALAEARARKVKALPNG